MILITYDISDDKIRTKFSKFLCKFWRRLQYSVFEIRNSERLLRNIKAEIKEKYEKKFTNADSVIIFTFCKGCKEKIIKFWFAKNDESDIIFV